MLITAPHRTKDINLDTLILDKSLALTFNAPSSSLTLASRKHINRGSLDITPDACRLFLKILAVTRTKRMAELPLHSFPFVWVLMEPLFLNVRKKCDRLIRLRDWTTLPSPSPGNNYLPQWVSISRCSVRCADEKN